jgi:protein TonB
MQTNKTILSTYELYVPTNAPFVDWIFRIVLVAAILGFIGTGTYFTTVEPEQIDIAEKISRIRTQFIIQEKKPVVEKPKPKPKKKIEQKKPIDLSNKPKLKAKVDDIKKPTKKPKVRRIYGLKRVYSKGIGAGGRLSDAVIGKMGNTINKDVDDLKATKKDIVGEVVSVTTVETLPKYIRKPRPEYSQEMRENQVEGVIKVKVLIDIDGKAKQAIVLNDLGFGSAEIARKACFEAVFAPATRGGRPMSVWITIPIRFELLGT